MGALDKVENNLPNSVREADIILLTLPMNQIRETIEYIAQDLKEGAVVMDTGPVKEVVANWTNELLPEEGYYVGLTPVINPAFLQALESGVEAASADLFRGGLMAIVAPPRTSSEAVKLAADLTRLLGATALFADPLEIDGLMAATHILPQIISAAFLNATVDQPGWREARKVAGRYYAEVTAPIVHLSQPETLRTSALLNRNNVLRMIDSSIAALQAIRSDIDNNDSEALDERLKRARQGRERWWSERQRGEFSDQDPATAVEMPKSSDIFSRLLGVNRRSRSKE
ncbi:MAG TPA: prephenate dehydrogenase/arogenate dehydrogenase family protein, partial [Anaerolineales bacterium]|nr:prephenate dehydrogenase/arogenate dehydrogenase family protein [Anaerolineales bacterium]